MYEAGRVGAEPERGEAKRGGGAALGKPVGGLSRLLLECVDEPAIYLLDARGCLVGRNVGASRIERGERQEPPGEPFSLLYSEEEVASGKPKEDLATAAGEGRLESEGWRVRADGTPFWAESILAAVRDSSRRLEGFVLFLRELSEEGREERPLRVHAQRQEAMARFAAAALAGAEPDRLLDGAVRLAAQELGAEAGVYLESVPEGGTLVLRAAVGLREDLVGQLRVKTPSSVQAERGSGTSAVGPLEALCTELGRDVPVVLRRHGVVSGSLAGVRAGATSLGVLGVYAREPRVFDAQERGFLRELASLLGQSLERREADRVKHRFAAVLEDTPDCVAVMDSRGRLLYVNAAGRRLRGLGLSDDVCGQDLVSWLPSHAASRVLQEGIPTALREGVWVGKTVLLDNRGCEIPVSQVIVAHRDPAGKVEYLSTTLRGMTQARQVEERLRLLAELGEELMGVLDPETAVAGVRRLVVPRLADVCIVDLVEGDEVRRVLAAHHDRGRELQLSAIGGAPIGVHSVLETGDPELVPEVSDAWIWAATLDEERFEAIRRLEPRSALIVPLLARGHRIGVFWLLHTDSGRRYGEADLPLAEALGRRFGAAFDALRVHQQALQATRMRDEALGVVAHDLRNPLHTISMAVNVLEGTHASPSATQRKYLEVIRRSAHEASRLVQDLHNVALLETGHLAIHPRSLAVEELVRDALDLFRPLAEDRGVRLLTEVVDGLGRVRADRGRVLQVFSNLIGNALRYTDAGGRIVVAADAQRESVRFSVADTGRGIADQEIPHLFERSRKPTPTARPGLGLGIAKSIVEGHGGEIWVESSIGGGTTFFFTLPSE